MDQTLLKDETPTTTPLPVDITNPCLNVEVTNCTLPVWLENCSVSVDWAPDSVVGVKPEDAGLPQTVVVGTTVMIVLGDAGWTATDPDQYYQRYVEITNCTGDPIFVRAVASGSSPTVSSADYQDKLYAGERAVYALSPMQEMQVVRSSGTGNVCARRLLR